MNNDDRAPSSVPLMARDEEGFLFVRPRGRITFPSRRKGPASALFEFVSVRNYRAAQSFLLDYGPLLPSDSSFVMECFWRYAVSDSCKREAQADRIRYRSYAPLAGPNMRTGIPYCLDAVPQSDGKRKIERTRKTDCVSIGDFFAETADPRSFPEDEALKARDARTEQASRAVLELGTQYFARALCGESGGRAGAAAFEAKMRARGLRQANDLEDKIKEARWENPGGFGADRLAEGTLAFLGDDAGTYLGHARILGILDECCEGQRISEFEMYRDFFRSALSMLAVSQGEGVPPALGSRIDSWADGGESFVSFDLPGFASQGVFEEYLDALTFDNPFANCRSLAPGKRKRAHDAFIRHVGRGRWKDFKHRLVYPLDNPTAEGASGTEDVREQAWRTCQFLSNIFTEGRIGLPRRATSLKGRRSRTVSPETPLLSLLYEAYVELVESQTAVRMCATCGTVPIRHGKRCTDSCRAASRSR